MRSIKETTGFPYNLDRVCYIEIDGNGAAKQIPHRNDMISDACKNVLAGQSKIYAVWPGEHRSDLFIVDDIAALAAAFDVPFADDDHLHEIDYELSPYDNGISMYAKVNVVFKCGCEVDFDNIKKIAKDLYNQFGWSMATSTGYNSSYDGKTRTYTFKIKRSTINAQHNNIG